MNVKEYIASGILESYLARKLDKEQELEVERIVALYPEVKAHLDILKKELETVAMRRGDSERTIPETFSNHIREDEREDFLRILESNDELALRNLRFLPSWIKWIVAGFVFSIILNIYLFFQLEQSRQSIQGVLEDNSRLSSSFENVQQSYQTDSVRISHLLNQNNTHIRLEGLDGHPKAMASVFWNNETQQVSICADELPKPPSGYQYQLWAVNEGTAENVGVFDCNRKVQALKEITGVVDSFVVTLEPEGGSESATTSQTFVQGFLRKK